MKKSCTELQALAVNERGRDSLMNSGKDTSQELAQSARPRDFNHDVRRVKSKLSRARLKLGPNHPGLCHILEELGILYLQMEEFGKAKSLYEQSLAIAEHAFGSDHLMVSYPLNYLGDLFILMDEYDKARDFLLRGLAIQEKTLGTNHYDLASTLNSLALVYLDSGEHAEAENCLLRFLAIAQSEPSYPQLSIGMSCVNLAVVKENQGRYKQASELYKRASKIFKSHADTDDPWIVESIEAIEADLKDCERSGSNKTRGEPKRCTPNIPCESI